MRHSSGRFTFNASTLIAITFVFYAITVIVHLSLALFTKTIDVHPDELRYLDTARSLLESGALSIRGDESDFQKILYPLLIAPALLLPDPATQIKGIAVLNSLYASSVVFPVAFIAHKVLPSPGLKIAAVALAACFPEICYSATFMSECVYVPLALWCLIALWSLFKMEGKPAKLRWLLAGVLCYATYLCKEVGLCFLLAALILSLVRLKGQTRARRLSSLVNLAALLIGFCLPFLILKLTLFSGMGNSYNQSSVEALRSLYAVLFGFIAIAENYTSLLIGFCIVPLLIPLLTYRTASKDDRILTALTYLALVITFLAIVYTISIREDVGYTVIRQHLRYLSWSMLPLLVLTLKAIATAPRISPHRTPRTFALTCSVVAVSAVAICAFYGSADLSQGFDTCMLHFHRVIAELNGALPVETFYMGNMHAQEISAEFGGPQAINWILWVGKILLVLALLGLTALFLYGSRRLACNVTIGFVLAMFMANSICCSIYNYDAYHVDDVYRDATFDLSDHLQEIPEDQNITLVFDEDNTLVNNLLDTFGTTHCRDNITYTNTSVLKADALDGTTLDVELLQQYGIAGKDQDEEVTISYLVANTHLGISLSGPGVQAMPLGYKNLYLLYKVVPDQPIYVTIEKQQD